MAVVSKWESANVELADVVRARGGGISCSFNEPGTARSGLFPPACSVTDSHDTPNQWLMMGMKRMSGAVWIIFCAMAMGALGCSEEGVMAVPEGPQLTIVSGQGGCPAPADDCEPLDMLLWERVDDAINWLGGCPPIQSLVGSKLFRGEILQFTQAWWDGPDLVMGAWNEDTGIIYIWWGLSDVELRKTMAHEGAHDLGMDEDQAIDMETTCVQDPALPPSGSHC